MVSCLQTLEVQKCFGKQAVGQSTQRSFTPSPTGPNGGSVSGGGRLPVVATEVTQGVATGGHW